MDFGLLSKQRNAGQEAGVPGFAQMALNMRADGADGLPDLDAAPIRRHFTFFLMDRGL